MEQIIYNALTKLQEIQRDTLNTNINIDIEPRFEYDTKTPWLSVTASTESWYMLPKEEKKARYIHECISPNPSFSDRVNAAIIEDQIENIVNFVKTFSNEN